MFAKTESYIGTASHKLAGLNEVAWGQPLQTDPHTSAISSKIIVITNKHV